MATPAQSGLDLEAQAKTLRFEAAPHKYYLDPDGIELVSVTTALKDAGLLDYSMIPQNVLLAAARRGTAVHQALHYLDEGDLDADTVSHEISGYILAYQNFCKNSRFVPGLIEEKVWHRQHFYAGTLDRTGMIGDELILLDFKTGIVFPAHGLQLAAYAQCLPEPRRFRRIALQLEADGDYRVHEYEGKNLRRDFEVFLAALACAKWQRFVG